MKCIKCGSYAINEGNYDRVLGVDSDLCDVHYWMKRAARITELQAQLADWKALHIAVTSGASYWPNNWSQDVAMVAYALHRKENDAERYLKLRRMAVELSLSHQVISQFVTNQGELDAAIQAEGKAQLAALPLRARAVSYKPRMAYGYTDVIRELQAQLEAFKTERKDLISHMHTQALKIQQLEAAKKDATRWQAVKPMFRTMSANIDGNHTWTLAYHGSLKGASMDDAADKVIQAEGKQA